MHSKLCVLTRLLFVLSLCSLRGTLAGQDKTLQDQANGADVVQASIQKITTSGIFPDDFGFLRRIAYVESKDGSDPNTFAKPNGKGIWQLDRAGFDDTKDTAAHPSLTAKYADIKNELGIDWSTVTYDDMNTPLYNALAARLFLSNQPGSIPVDLASQAQYWKTYYNTPAGAGTVDKFISDVNRLESSQTQCDTPSLDVVFVLDSSGSIETSNFAMILSFVQSVVGYFDIGENKVHVGVIEFASGVLPVISLNSTYNIATLKQTIAAIPYLASGTNTADAISELVGNTFLESKGARPSSQGVPRIGIVVTDGQSNAKLATQAAAARAHAANIRMFAVGVGSANMNELRDIATDPDSLHVFLLAAFSDFAPFANRLKQVTCTASTILNPQQRSVDGKLQKNQKRYIQSPVSQEQGGTLQLTVSSGAVVAYVSMSYANPSEALYDQSVSVAAGQKKDLFLATSSGTKRFKRQVASNATSNATVPAFISIAGLADQTSFKLTVVDGNQMSGARSPSSFIAALVFFLFASLLTAL